MKASTCMARGHAGISVRRVLDGGNDRRMLRLRRSVLPTALLVLHQWLPPPSLSITNGCLRPPYPTLMAAFALLVLKQWLPNESCASHMHAHHRCMQPSSILTLMPTEVRTVWMERSPAWKAAWAPCHGSQTCAGFGPRRNLEGGTPPQHRCMRSWSTAASPMRGIQGQGQGKGEERTWDEPGRDWVQGGTFKAEHPHNNSVHLWCTAASQTKGRGRGTGKGGERARNVQECAKVRFGLEGGTSPNNTAACALGPQL